MKPAGMKRVVITGLGIVSCLGSDRASVTASLRGLRSGIRAIPEYKELGFRSQVGGMPDIDLDARIDRKQRRFQGDAAAFAHIAMEDAIADAGLSAEGIVDPRIGLIAGSGGGSCDNQVQAADLLRAKGVRRVGPYMVTRTMCSTVSANLATAFHIRGVNYSLSSACATSAHCIGAAMEQIQLGKQDIVFAGGGGMVVVESLEHAQARGAKILAEVIGYGATSDGADMVAPSGEGAARCMRQALATVDSPIDYLNTHGTSTPVGDVAELGAIREVFGDKIPPFSSTKSLSGHSLGAAGVHEAIYCLLMMEGGFVAGSANVDNLDPAAEGMPIVRATRDAHLDTVMSNSFGFGGTNATLVLRRFNG
jgi:3-oxoacyl-[acyl-carrier-protein] synthase-1